MNAYPGPRFPLFRLPLVADRAGFPHRQASGLVEESEEGHLVAGKYPADRRAGNTEGVADAVWPKRRLNLSAMIRRSRFLGSWFGDR